MNTYRCARELEGYYLRIGDLILFSGFDTFTVRHNKFGWYLNSYSESNDAVFKYLNKASPYDYIKELGDYPTVLGGVFPYLETAKALTEVVSKLFLEVERKRFREFDFKRYVPKGDVTALSKDTISKLCKNQVEQGNIFDVGIFENYCCKDRKEGGMTWTRSMEGDSYWRAELSPKEIETDQFGRKKIAQNPLSLATLSAKRTQKPKLRTL